MTIPTGHPVATAELFKDAFRAHPAGIAVITQMRPISVVFAIPEVQLPDLMAQVRAGRTLSVEAWSRDD